MLRITDILLRNLIWAAATEDRMNLVTTSTEKVDALEEKIVMWRHLPCKYIQSISLNPPPS